MHRVRKAIRDTPMMYDESMLCSCWMTLKWAILALLCQLLVQQQGSGLLSTATRLPTSTSVHRKHTGKGVEHGKAATPMCTMSGFALATSSTMLTQRSLGCVRSNIKPAKPCILAWHSRLHRPCR